MLEFEYRLPFDTQKNPLRITQGWNGPWSHKRYLSRSGGEHDVRFAVDFALPPDTEVLAARTGRVTGLLLASMTHYTGSDPEIGNNLSSFSTNMIVIDHGDGTQAYYSHLRYMGSPLSTEEYVQTGQLIGYTGLSGWIGNTPHLHFMVKRVDICLPVRFIDYSGPLEHSELFPESK